MAVRQRSGGLVILVVSIVAGLLAALLSVSFLKGVAGTTTVLVAARDIPAFTPLRADMFAIQQIPSSAVPADAVKDGADLNGRYARTLLISGTVMRQSHLAAATGSGSSIAAMLTEMGQTSMRAIAIPVDDATGVGGGIQPGDKVDILATVRLERTNGPSTTYSKIIARAVPVLHRTEADGTAKGTVVVMVSPQVAEEIGLAQMSGTIFLALNPYRIDTEPVQTNGVTPDTFMQRHSGR